MDGMVSLYLQLYKCFNINCAILVHVNSFGYVQVHLCFRVT